MTSHRDRYGATVLRDGRVLIAGGVNTVLVPLIIFPGPAMPWILSSAEIFDPIYGPLQGDRCDGYRARRSNAHPAQ